MKIPPETIDTVIRHLKGIVAALENEKGTVEIIKFTDIGVVDNEFVSSYLLSTGETVTYRSPLYFKCIDRYNKERSELRLIGVSDKAFALFDRQQFDKRKASEITI